MTHVFSLQRHVITGGLLILVMIGLGSLSPDNDKRNKWLGGGVTASVLVAEAAAAAAEARRPESQHHHIRRRRMPRKHVRKENSSKITASPPPECTTNDDCMTITTNCDICECVAIPTNNKRKEEPRCFRKQKRVQCLVDPCQEKKLVAQCFEQMCVVVSGVTQDLTNKEDETTTETSPEDEEEEEEGDEPLNGRGGDGITVIAHPNMTDSEFNEDCPRPDGQTMCTMEYVPVHCTLDNTTTVCMYSNMCQALSSRFEKAQCTPAQEQVETVVVGGVDPFEETPPRSGGTFNESAEKENNEVTEELFIEVGMEEPTTSTTPATTTTSHTTGSGGEGGGEGKLIYEGGGGHVATTTTTTSQTPASGGEGGGLIYKGGGGAGGGHDTTTTTTTSENSDTPSGLIYEGGSTTTNNSNNKEFSCDSDKDCILYSSYCLGCNCLALHKNENPPVCDDEDTVRCFADPCSVQSNAEAVCKEGACFREQL